MKTEPEFGGALEDSGPGAHLRRAREAANMNADKVAAALLLHPKTIEAIEADSFDRLPAPTFVRGYLRGYARVLGLPAGPILEMYDRHEFEPPPLASDVMETQQAHTSDTPVRLVTYAVAAVLVLLVGLWWHSQEDGGFGIVGDLFDWSPDASPDPSFPTAEGAAAGTVTIDGETGGESIVTAPDRTDEQPQDDDPRATVSGAATDREALATRASQSEAEVGADLAIGADRAAETSPGDADGGDAPTPDGTGRADGADESASASLPAVTPSAVPATPSSETAPTDTGAVTATVETIRPGLVLEFGNESWVEIYDRERTRLFLGLVQPGRTLSFDGAQPFDVLLGSGGNVRVRIDGEVFDHEPYMRHGVARFSVGSAPEGGSDATESSGTTATDATSPAEPSQTQGRGE